MRTSSRVAVFSEKGCQIIASITKVNRVNDSAVLEGWVENGNWTFKANILRGTMDFDPPSGHVHFTGLMFVPVSHIPDAREDMDYNELLSHIEQIKFDPLSLKNLMILRARYILGVTQTFCRRIPVAFRVFWAVMCGRGIEAALDNGKPKEPYSSFEDDDIPF